MAIHQCIYCLQKKEESEFNREHVVPRMMGTYQNGFVLNDCQVCKKCNTYFDHELENVIGLDSFEGLLRMQHGNKTMSDGRTLQGNRVSFTGNEGVFKGLKFTVVADKANEERIHFAIASCIGILRDHDSKEYDYYAIKELPPATDEVLARIKKVENGIVTVELEREEAELALKEKGYLSENYQYTEKPVTDLHSRPNFDTQIRYSIDAIVRRVCAKTAFNYLCYSKGVEFALQPRFNEIRNYIRYGTWSDNLWFRYSQGPVSTAELPNDTAHSVGYMLFAEDGNWVLCGCLTWFGQLTYIFKLGITDIKVSLINILPCTKMANFNNENQTIEEDEAIFVYGGRPKDH